MTLANGDRITGEVVTLERGTAGVQDRRRRHAVPRMGQADQRGRNAARRGRHGRRQAILGSLGPADRRFIAVVSAAGDRALAMADVTIIRPIGASFWQKLDGSVDAGFNYTRSSGVAQLNFNSDTVYRSAASRARLAASLTITQNEDDPGRDDRGIGRSVVSAISVARVVHRLRRAVREQRESRARRCGRRSAPRSVHA